MSISAEDIKKLKQEVGMVLTQEIYYKHCMKWTCLILRLIVVDGVVLR
jgi:hypothetical protein